jgi:hypothetical protein
MAKGRGVPVWGEWGGPSPWQILSTGNLYQRLTRGYVSAEDADVPAFNVRRDGTIRHFWSGEMGAVTADPGQDRAVRPP